MKELEMAKMYVDDEIKKAVMDALDSRRYIKGEQNEKFEKEFAKFCGTKYAITVNSGTSALILALKARGLKHNSEVIIPSHTFIASANAVFHAGLKPIFADIDEETYTLDIEDVEEKITKDTRAIMPVHLYGHPANMEPLRGIAKENNLYIVEDACQAHGAMYKEQKCGAIGDIAAFSFFPSKNMTVSGDGGMVTTNNEELAEKISALRDQGRKKGEKYRHDLIGYNFRMSEIHATIGREQLRHLSEWIEKRRRNAAYYNELISDIKEIQTPMEKKWAKHVYHLYVIRSKERDKLSRFLMEKEIPFGIHYPIPVHQQPIFNEESIKLNKTEKIAREVLSLPMHPFMEEEQIEYIASKIKEFFREAKW